MVFCKGKFSYFGYLIPAIRIRMSPENSPLLVYGTTWCPDCTRVRRFLDANQIAYQWINIDKDPDACAIVEKINHGNQSVPTLVWADGSLLVEPSIRQLRDRLGL
jgi:mycoredoxin